MRAVVYDRYGGPEVLRLAEVERPVPEADEVLIRVRAAEVTKSDTEMRSFRFAVWWFWLALRLAMGLRKPRRRILGSYFAGEVVEVGEEVQRLMPGAEVFGCSSLRLGAHAEYLTVPASYTVVRKPPSLSFAEAAAVPMGGLNALHFLRRAKVEPGESVLVNGAGGSIGAHAVQIAKAMGAEVTAVDDERKRDLVLRLGADRFVDYTRDDFALHGAYDVLFDMVPGSSYGRSIRALKPGGRYLAGNPRLAVMLRSLLTSRFTSKKAFFAFAGETPEQLRALREMAERGELRSIVDRVLPIEQAAEAHRLVESEERRGAIVISMDD